MSTDTSVTAVSTVRPLVRLSGIVKRFGPVVALDRIDLDIEDGEFLAILGPSGCGKSTLLRILGGFETPDGGGVEIDGRDVTGVGPEARPTNLVFQGFGLFPHMSVARNVGYGLRVRGTPRDEIGRRVDEMLALVRLQGLGSRLPSELSGGQQQRVALARALIMRPRLLLLDESLGALDLKLREEMQEELRRIHRQTGGTFVIVTHDQNEAFVLADRIVVMNRGRIEQVGSPREVYDDPRSLFVAGFVGAINRFPAVRRDDRLHFALGSLADPGGPDAAVVVLRLETIRLAPAGCGGAEAIVTDQTFKGTGVDLTATLADGTQVLLTIPREAPPPPVGSPVSLDFDPTAARVFGSLS